MARTRKKYAHQGDTTGTSSDYLQLRSFLKIETSLKGKNLLPSGSEFFPLRAVPFGMETHFTTLGDLPLMLLFLLRTCVTM